MNLPKGTTLDDDIIFTDNNHNDNGNPHTQYCQSINKSFGTAIGYNLIYSRTVTMTSHCLVISGKVISTIQEASNSFDFLCQLTLRNSVIGKVYKTSNDKIKFCYKQNGNLVSVQIYISIDNISENYFIIPTMDFYSSVNGDDYMYVLPPSPLIGSTGFKFSSKTDYTELPNEYTVI